MKERRQRLGFTLAELLVGLMVTSIVLTAVATLAFAMSSANTSSDDMAAKEAQIRFAILRLEGLVRNSRLIMGTPSNCLVVWKCDVNGDSMPNSNELAYIRFNTSLNELEIDEYGLCAGSEGWTTQPSSVQNGAALNWLTTYCIKTSTLLIPSCSNAAFKVNNSAVPCRSTQAWIAFDMMENGVSRHYEVSATLAGAATNRLDAATNNLFVTEDD
jgi:prepilin-type N-terminal cleavage/methylation domain-containing protein